MKRILTIAAVALAASLAFCGTPARATEGHAAPSFDTCANLSGWFVNGDEEDRKPTPTKAGLEFSGADLIHHAADVALADLEPGNYAVLASAPDQTSFFSVEVRDLTTGGYGTLRWNTATSVWDLTTNLGSFSHADPADFVGTATKWGELTSATRVATFGVGYTKTPPGTVETVVKSVRFQGKTYPLTCYPPKPTTPPTTAPTTTPATTAPTTTPATTEPTTTPATTAPTTRPTDVQTSPAVTPSASRSAPAVARPTTTNVSDGSDSLPVTGPGVGYIVAAGALLALGGLLVLVLASRSARREKHFRL